MNFLAFMVTIFGTSLAIGGPLQDLLHDNADKLAVISYVESARDYGLLILPKEYFSEKLGTVKYGDRLENDFFKVVEEEGETALPLSDLDGRNVFYHLNKARDFFLQLDSHNIALWRKQTVRVR